MARRTSHRPLHGSLAPRTVNRAMDRQYLTALVATYADLRLEAAELEAHARMLARGGAADRAALVATHEQLRRLRDRLKEARALVANQAAEALLGRDLWAECAAIEGSAAWAVERRVAQVRALDKEVVC